MSRLFSKIIYFYLKIILLTIEKNEIYGKIDIGLNMRKAVCPE